MVADISDEVRLDIGKDRAALLYGLITSTSKVGSTLSVVITFGILAAFGFDAKEGVVNTGVAAGRADRLLCRRAGADDVRRRRGAWGYKLDQNEP